MQYVGVEALSYSKNTLDYIEFQNKMFDEVNSYCHKKLEDMKIKCSNTKGAWYKLINFSYYKNKLNKRNIITSQDLANALLKDLQCVFGNYFGIKKELIFMIDIK